MAYHKRPDLSGQILGGFELRKQIGKGYFGDVYEAVYRPNGKLFALKVLDVDASVDAQRRFRSEFKLLSTLESPRLVRAHHFGELPDGELYFSSDLLPGQNFGRYLDEHREIRADQAILWVRQICEAVQALHERGVLHRDLKPANMQLDDQGELTLFDLGSCKCLPLYYADAEREYLTAPEDRHVTAPAKRHNLCTTGYRAPEAVDVEPSVQLDIYSIGAILHRILLGYTPDRSGAAEARESIEPAELLELLEGAIAEDPECRFRSVKTLSRDLDHTLDMVLLELGIEPDVLKTLEAEAASKNEDVSETPEGVDAPEEPEESARAHDEPGSVGPRMQAIPQRSWMRDTLAASVVFALGWFASGLFEPSVPSGDDVDTSAVSEFARTPVEPSVPNMEPKPPTAETSPICLPPSTPNAVWSRSIAEEPLEVTVPAVKPKQAPEKPDTRAKVKPQTTGKTATGSFERDLKARLVVCQLPPQSVHYQVKRGELERLQFDKPNNFQHSCVTVGLQEQYGQENFSGTVTIGEPS